jgi:hypothetical protein
MPIRLRFARRQAAYRSGITPCLDKQEAPLAICCDRVYDPPSSATTPRGSVPETDPFDDTRGPYIGPCTPEEALAAFTNHSSVAIIEYPEHGFAGSPDSETKRVAGYCSQIGDEDSAAFVFTEKQDIPLGCAIAYADAFVLDLTWSNEEPSWRADRYTDGLDLHFPGALVRVAFWHEAYHVTESGDSAPGLGSFQAES